LQDENKFLFKIEVQSLFLQTFPPWELHEMITMWRFVKDCSESLLDMLLDDPVRNQPSILIDGMWYPDLDKVPTDLRRQDD